MRRPRSRPSPPVELHPLVLTLHNSTIAGRTDEAPNMLRAVPGGVDVNEVDSKGFTAAAHCAI